MLSLVNRAALFAIRSPSVRFHSSLTGPAKTIVKQNISHVKIFKRNAFGPKGRQIESSSNRVGNGVVIFRSFLFTVGFGATCYAVSTIAFMERNTLGLFQKFPTKKFIDARDKMNAFWNSQTDLQKCALAIIFANMVVFMAWRVPGIAPTMMKYFLHFPAAEKYYQMILSTFSHTGFLHLSLNMFCLYSISGTLSTMIQPEQFVAFYLSSGVFASFASGALKIATNNPYASIGASGALMACFALVALTNPTAKFIIFPIPYPIEASTLIKCVVAFDVIGLLTGFTRLDHAAHLGGVLYGWLFVNFSMNYLKEYQITISKLWKKIKQN